MIFLVFVSQTTLSWDAPVNTMTRLDEIALQIRACPWTYCTQVSILLLVWRCHHSARELPVLSWFRINESGSCHSLTFWIIFIFSDSKTVCDSNSGVASIWLHFLFPVFVLVILIISSKHPYPLLFNPFMFF